MSERNFKGEAIEATVTDLTVPRDSGAMVESLDEAIRAKFYGQSDAQLIRRIERAPDFGYDDEAYELNRRLTLVGMAWKWSQKYGRDVVVVYTPEQPESPENAVLGYD